MADQQNKLSKFWDELKRRKVIRVIIVYATTAFILLQLVDLIKEPLDLPHWVMTFFIVLLFVGFPIAVIFSWIFDITPQGIEVTQSGDKKIKSKSNGFFSKKYVVFDIIIGVLLILVVILAYPKIFSDNPVNELEKSIAVLPFIDDSPEEGQTYIVNGLMEEILNKLQKVHDLNVKSRTSVEEYRGSKKNIQQIAQELNVNYIVEGSGLKSGNRIKLMVQLIEAKTGNHLWSNPYIKEVDEDKVFELWEDIAFSVAEELEAIITPEEKELIEKKPTESIEAWNLYLEGRRDWNNYLNNGESSFIRNAQNKLTEAIIIDPNFSRAYAELGNVYSIHAHFSNDAPRTYWENAHSTLTRAIDLNPNEGYIYTYLGVVQTLYLHDSLKARASFNKALEISSNEPQVYADLYYFESRLGNCANLERAMQQRKIKFNEKDIFNGLNPANLKLLTCHGNHLKIIDIVNELEKSENWNYSPSLVGDHMIINAYLQENNFEKAMEFAEIGTRKIQNPSYIAINKGIVYAMKGDTVSANKILKELDEIAKYKYVSPTLISAIYAALDNKGKAIEFLEKAINDCDWRLLDMFEFAPYYQKRNEPWLEDIIHKSWTPIEVSETK